MPGSFLLMEVKIGVDSSPVGGQVFSGFSGSLRSPIDGDHLLCFPAKPVLPENKLLHLTCVCGRGGGISLIFIEHLLFCL